MLSAVLAAAFALMAESAVVAPDTSSAPASAPVAQATPAKPQKICRKEVVMGTRLPKTVCKTAEQAKQDTEDSQAAIRLMQGPGGSRSN